ncbi:hypothetical protein [Methylobacterium planeticum]|uniref:Uncharacterized protein n=1 Tax=Methylobacterium planeticum TaxID=2615211 RepID=A0A6N6MGN7_9HYPH|nr:hypothetical protein [Methylobacterium planeticum]KAB1068601.1 hypothetical protein F6X51_26590 [Methylobacterium planeticum]
MADPDSVFCIALQQGRLDTARDCIQTVVQRLNKSGILFDHEKALASIGEWLRQRECISRTVRHDGMLKSMPPQVLISLEITGRPSDASLGLALSLGERLEVVSLSPMPARAP